MSDSCHRPACKCCCHHGRVIQTALQGEVLSTLGWLTLRNSGHAVPEYRYLFGHRRLAFSPGCAKGHCSRGNNSSCNQYRETWTKGYRCSTWVNETVLLYCGSPESNHVALSAGSVSPATVSRAHELPPTAFHCTSVCASVWVAATRQYTNLKLIHSELI